MFDSGSVACDKLSFRSRDSGGQVVNVVEFVRDCLSVVVSGFVRTPLCRYGEDFMCKLTGQFDWSLQQSQQTRCQQITSSVVAHTMARGLFLLVVCALTVCGIIIAVFTYSQSPTDSEHGEL